MILRSVSALSLLAASIAAHAGLLGSTVNLSIDNPERGATLVDYGRAVVGSQVEYPNLFGAASIDLSDTSLTLTTFTNGTFNTANFNGYAIDAAPAGMVFTSASLAGGATISPTVSILDGRLYLNVSGIPFQGGQTATVNFTTQAVPEPASMAALGLGAVAMLRRRKRA